MTLRERKEKLEIGTYQKEVHEELQAAYEQSKFAKYAQEQNFDTFIWDGKKNSGGCIVLVEENHVKHWRDEKTKSGVVHKGIDAVTSFKKFVGKEINLQGEDSDGGQTIGGVEKLKRLVVKGRSRSRKGCDGDNLWGFPSGQDGGEDILERIDQIRHAIAEVRSTIRRKIDMRDGKHGCPPDDVRDGKHGCPPDDVRDGKHGCPPDDVRDGKHGCPPDDVTELLLNFAQLRNHVDELTTSVGAPDPRLGGQGQLDGHLKRGDVTSGGEEQHEQGIKNSYVLLDCQLDERDEETAHHEGYISLRKRNLHTMLQQLQAKVEQYEWLLTEGCSHEKGGADKGQSAGHTLLSIAMFLNLCMSDNMGKRILNYIYLLKIEMKKCRQYLANLKKGKSLDIFCSHVESLTKGVPREEDPATFVDKLFRINLTPQNEQVLALYKRLLHSELGVDLMLREVEAVNGAVERVCHKLEGGGDIRRDYAG
ncbi:unnamed protein product [Plasmodium vivax]|uniref:(malaria parasite P. vivax) hypothetical protein n=1 Tax=Plasmodium vivax TaxID=5855 RepID=A0A8S4HHF6_PLAVI|nr:unnamed protein product [Plasmodium vivax]